MNEFKEYHPIVNITYFISAFVLCWICRHPFCLAISLFCGFAYLTILRGMKYTARTFLWIPSLFVLVALMYTAFNHRGETILTYLPSDNPLTLESICYGMVLASAVVSLILVFMCFNEVMTSDKFVYLLGKVTPSLSLFLSVILAFIPKFIKQFKATAESRKCIGKSILSSFSIMLTWSLENAVDASISMRSRGYSLGGRSAFSIFTFSKRDINVLTLTILLAFYVIVGIIRGVIFFDCFPFIQIADFSPYGMSVFTAYFFLVSLPLIIELWEMVKWKFIQSGI